MKKCIAIILVLAFAVSMFQVVSFADEAAAPENQTTQEITLENDEYTYADYLEDNKDIADATSDIFVAGNAYSSVDGAAVEAAEHTDENGVTVKDAIKWIGEKGTVNYTFTVENAGMYEIALAYCPINGRGLPLRFSFLIDGSLPYASLSAVNFERTFVDDKPEGVADGNGNVYASEQVEKTIFKEIKAMDNSGQYVAPLKVNLTAGTHTISLTAMSGEFYLKGIILSAPDVIKDYSEVKKEYEAQGLKNYTGADITIEGENAIYKSTASTNPLIDNSDPSLTGINGSRAEAFKSIVNYIGGTGWQKPNETLIWTVDVPEDGLYKVGFRFRQNVVISGNSYRSLTVDGVSPFTEAQKIPFYYGGNWQFNALSTKDGEKAYIYLTKGKHEIGLTVTLADFGEVSREIGEVTYDIGNLYLKIRMITGEQIDTGRSYEFFKNIPQFNETLTASVEKLQKIRQEIVDITNETSGTYIATVDNMIRVMNDMLNNPYTAQNYVTSYYDSYTSLCALVTDIAKLPLDLDQIVLSSPEKDNFDFELAGWWDKTVYGVERFIVSFMEEYQYDTKKAEGVTNLTLWVTWGRDQTQILTSLVRDTFEAEHPNIKVNIQIVGATLIQAILAGSGPDLLIGQTRTEPVNYGMRGALYDLSQFPDYNEVISRYQKGADNPYKLGDAIYGIPDTQNFSIMFYRSDILEEMGVEVPKDWEEFKNVAALFQRQNLAVGLPAGDTTVNTFATRLMQKNIPVYTENQRTNFLSGEAVETFVDWTNYYTELGFLKAYDFYNRFRAGTIPLAVADYTQYTLLSQAAPEIVGKWGIAKMPGTKAADGTINYTQADTGTACVIPNISEHKEEAWEFLKWWTSANTQYRYSVMLEAILGDTGRRATANIEAFKMLSWESNHLDILLDAWENVVGLQEVPGGYYVDRSVMQAFRNVVNISENPKDMIFKWAKIADQEIDRKRGEYGLE